MFGMRGVKIRMNYPTIEQFEQICRMFLAASDAFDRMLFKPGSRRTDKDRLYSSESHCSRHNMPNYNLCWHQITYHLGIRAQTEAHFYWPLLKTTKVLTNLQEMWGIIAKKFSWNYAEDLATLLDPDYKLDSR